MICAGVLVSGVVLVFLRLCLSLLFLLRVIIAIICLLSLCIVRSVVEIIAVMHFTDNR